MAVIVTNNAQTTLSANITSTQTTIPLTTGAGASFPHPTAPDFAMATMANASGVIEIVKITSVSGDTLNVVRGQEGTTAFAFSAGDNCAGRVTAGILANKLDKDTGGVIPAGGGLGLGGTPVKPLHVFGAGSAEIEMECLTGLSGHRSYNLLVAGTPGTSQYFILRQMSDDGLTTNFDAFVCSGTGVVDFPQGLTSNGAAVVDLTSAQTLVNKTLTNPAISTIYSGGSPLTLPSATTDTLVGRATTDTLTHKTLTAIASTSSVDDGTGSGPFRIGFRDVPINAQNGNYTIAAADAGKGILSQNSGAQTITIPTHASVAFAIGGAIAIVNHGSTAMSISPAAGVTVVLSGVGTTGARSLAPSGMATLWQVAADLWFVSGPGVS